MEGEARRLIRALRDFDYEPEFVVWAEPENGIIVAQFTTTQVVPEIIFGMRVDLQLATLGFKLECIERLNYNRSQIVVSTGNENEILNFSMF